MHLLMADVFDNERRKAADSPIPGAFKELAKYVRGLLGWEPNSPVPYLSLNQAALKTGLSTSVISAITKGGRPKFETVKRFGEAIGANMKDLYDAARYTEVAEIYHAAAKEAQADIDRKARNYTQPQPKTPLTEDPATWPQELREAMAYGDLSPGVKQYILKLYREKTFAEEQIRKIKSAIETTDHE